MTIPSASESNRIAVSSPPQVSADVEYFADKVVTLHVTNVMSDPILLEDVSLQFQADTGSAPIYVDHPCGIELPGTELAALSIPVTPTCRYLEPTNVFRVMVHYRVHAGGQLGSRATEWHNGSYLIIKKPKDIVGDVFISVTLPENVDLARLLERYARRAGLNPFLIVDDKQPGSRHWARIEEAIKRSNAVFIIWGKRTEWGTGVQREITLCRQHGINEVLLLERHLPVPELFEKAALDHEYSIFSVDDPGESFSAAVASIRGGLLDRPNPS